MAIDEPYERAVRKGTAFLHLLDTNHHRDNTIKQPRAASSTAFISSQDLEFHGFKGEVTHKCIDNTSVTSLAPALRGLGLSHTMACDGGKNIMVEHAHSENRIIDGVEYPATQATHIQICNPTEGVLIADSNHSAKFMAAFNELPIPITNITPLHFWSDIAWLQWLATSQAMQIAPPSASTTTLLPHRPMDLNTPISTPSIKFVFRLRIHHPPTYTILKKIAARQPSKTYDAWPGVTFDIVSEDGRAILGTPHGAGVAWMLIQRREESGVGGRKISRVTMFWAEGEGDVCKWPSLLFWIE